METNSERQVLKKIEFYNKKLWLKKESKVKKIYFYVLFIFILLNIIILNYIFKNDKTIYVLNKIISFFKNLMKISNSSFNNGNSAINNIFNQSLINGSNIMEMKNIKTEEKKENEDKIYYNNNIFSKFIKEQNDFCENSKKYYNLEYENQTIIAKVDFLGKKFNMFVYKNQDIVSRCILNNKNWESSETIKILEALRYYSNKLNISNEHIYILDIGSNVGWFTFYLGKYGYNIISFEVSDVNNYILKKNYCLNKELNITLVKQGLYNSEKLCDYYISIGNIGDGWVFCDKNQTIPSHLKKTGEAQLTRLSNYYPFFSNKNIALIKIDIEGSEGKVFEGGIELISKYHVPFILLEFTPDSLKEHGTNPREFLNLFETNGYKFSKLNFLSKSFVSVDQIMLRTKGLSYLYVVHSSILS